VKKLTLESLPDIEATVCIEDLTRKDALDWIATLRKDGNQPRTLFNRANNLNIFMRHFGLLALFGKKDKPKFTEKKVRAYNDVELAKMFEGATEDEADLLYFLLCTGAREQEASFACWTDLDLVAKSYTVTEHLDLGYRPRTRRRGLPIPDMLIDRMTARRKRHPRTRLIFETPSEKPERHMLRIIKQLALRAGVNCCECVNKAGQSCIEHPVCKHVILHKMRKTFATTVHHNGMPAKTVQRYLRHSDLNATLRYLADEPDEQVRTTINNTFVIGWHPARSPRSGSLTCPETSSPGTKPGRFRSSCPRRQIPDDLSRVEFVVLADTHCLDRAGAHPSAERAPRNVEEFHDLGCAHEGPALPELIDDGELCLSCAIIRSGDLEHRRRLPRGG
jgi:integrase